MHADRLGLHGRLVATAPASPPAASLGAISCPVGCVPVAPPRSCTACGSTGMIADKLPRARGRAGKVHDERVPDRAGDRARQRCHRRLGETSARISSAKPGASRSMTARRLRRHVAWPEPCAARRHDQPVRCREFRQDAFDLAALVGHDAARRDLEPARAQDRLREVARLVDPRAAGHPVRDGDHRGRDRRCHPIILAPRVPTDLRLARCARSGVRWARCPIPSPAPATGPLIDTFGRVGSDLRISVTDRCNFRCTLHACRGSRGCRRTRS